MNKNRLKKRKPLWPKILLGIAVAIVMIIGGCWMDDIYRYGFRDQRHCRDETGFLRKLMCGASETYDKYAAYLRSLPSDEEMIANFHKYRPEFERLVRTYREDMSVPTDFMGFLMPTADVKAVMNRLVRVQLRAVI
jgi:hypothetical protein